MAPDDVLDRLNASEQELLLLLGRGHTAKSIATLKDLTEPAVNERFRSARRKTGIGSSREIARLLVARENRDDFIGLAEPYAAPPGLPRPDAPRRASPLRRWSLPMSAALLIAAAVLVQQTAGPPSPPASPAASANFAPREPSPDAAALHAEVMAGGVDPAWSATTEAALRTVYERTEASSEALASLEVTCSASLCEVLGVGRRDLTDAVANRFSEAVQGPDVDRSGTAMGLHSVMNGFTVTRDDAVAGAPSNLRFAAYWRRVD
jgi:DNA-binding CsgD family transcriptional regulator